MILAVKRSLTLFVVALLAHAFACSNVFSSPKTISLSPKAVTKKVLDNGLTVLAIETTPQDLVSVYITLRAGSSLEGEYSGSGISHFVEHMVFKGTKTRKSGDVERQIKSYGGIMNGSVSQDLTTFYVTVPSKYLSRTLALLKDILLNAAFEKQEFEKEREVISNEIRLNNDDPQRQITKLLYETAYIAHPYRFPPGGYEKEFGALQREDLIKYYERMYAPNRMVVGLVGGMAAQDAIREIEAEFSDFRRPNYKLTDVVAQEPPQIGRRLVEKAMPINLAYLALGYHSTNLLDRDLFAMDVLAMIVGRGNNSRLNERLYKDEHVVHSIECANVTPRDPGLFVITALLDKQSVPLALSLIEEEIENCKNGETSPDELESAKRMVLSDYIFSRQSIEGEARDISTNESLTGNYDFSRAYVDGIQSVTKDDVRRVARRYLRGDNLTVAQLLPIGTAKESAVTAPAGTGQKDIIKREVLPNGLRILVRQNSKTPTVSIAASCLGGLMSETPATNGISRLTAEMMLKGTVSRKEEQVAGSLERVGGTISAFSGFNSFGLTLSFLSSDVDLALDIMHDCLLHSTFPQEELDKEKVRTLALIKDEDDDMFDKGSSALRKELFGDHPYGMRLLGQPESINAIMRDNIVNFYNTHCVAKNMVISISGDVEDGFIDRLKQMFADIPAGEITQAPNVPIVPLAKIKTQRIKMEKEESLVLMGYKTVSISDAERFGFEVLGSVLSGSSGRLFSGLRNVTPLAYALGCAQKWCMDTGYLIMYVATSPERIAQTKASLRDEINSIRSQFVSDEELAVAKRELTSNHKISMQTNEYCALQSGLDELYGVGYDAIYTYETAIDKVTRKDLKRIAERYLNPKAYAETIVSSR